MDDIEHLPNSKLYSDKVFEHLLFVPNSKHKKQMTCGDQQKTNTMDAATSMLAKRRRERRVEVCGNGSSDGGTRSSPFECARILCPYRNDLEKQHH